MELIFDAAFLADFNTSDKRIIDLLYKKYYEELIAFCWYFLKHQQDAEEAVADTFAKLMRKRKPIQEVNRIKNYVFIIARNLCIDMLKERGKYKACLRSYFFSVDKYIESPIEYLSLEKLLSYKSTSRINADLSEQQKKVLQMYCEGMSINEIALKMQLQYNTVSDHLNIARKKILPNLKAYGYTIKKRLPSILFTIF